MPRPQVLDLSSTPNRYGEAAADALWDAIDNKDKKKREQDAVNQVISNRKETDTSEDDWNNIFGTKDLSLDEKRQLHNDFSNQRKDIRAEKEKERLNNEREATRTLYETRAGVEAGTYKDADIGTLKTIVEDKIKKDQDNRRKDAWVKNNPDLSKDIHPEALENATIEDLNRLKPDKNDPWSPGKRPAPNDPALKDAYERYKEFRKVADIGQETLATVKDAREAIQKGGGDPQAWLTKVIPWFKSGETAKLENASVNLFKHFKAIFPRMTNVDVGLIEDVLPVVGQSREANEAILNMYESGANASIEKKRIADELMQAINEGKIPAYEFETRLQEGINRVEDSALEHIKDTADNIRHGVFQKVAPGFTLMLNKDGQIREVPKDKVEKAMKEGKWTLYGR